MPDDVEPVEFEWRGKTYAVTGRTPEADARFADLIHDTEAHAVAALRDRRAVTGAEAGRRLAALAAKCAADAHRPGGSLWAAYTTGEHAEEGREMYLLAMLRASDPGVSRGDVRLLLAGRDAAAGAALAAAVPAFAGVQRDGMGGASRRALARHARDERARLAEAAGFADPA